MRKLFVIGCPRSGTTLLQQILNRHTAIVIPPETAFFSSFLKRTRRGQARHLAQINADLEIELSPEQAGRTSSGPGARDLFEQIARRYLERHGRSTDPPTWFGDKTPFHLFEVDPIRALYPEARFLLLYRDGRSVALSLSEVPWSPPDPYLNFAIWLRCWREQQRLLVASTPTLLPVQYEALVYQPEQTLERILAFLELSSEPELLQPDANADAIPAWEMDWKALAQEPIRPDRAERWRQELDAEQISRLEAWGASELLSLGYELTADPPASLPPLFRLQMAIRLLRWRAGSAWRVFRGTV